MITNDIDYLTIFFYKSLWSVAYQIEDNIRTHKVIVEERLDGRLFITYKVKPLKYTSISSRPAKKEGKRAYGVSKKVYQLPADHPWKKFPIKPLRVSLKEKKLVMAKT